MLLLSVVAHIAILALLSLSIGRSSRALEGRIYTVDIVTLPVERVKEQTGPKEVKKRPEKKKVEKARTVKKAPVRTGKEKRVKVARRSEGTKRPAVKRRTPVVKARPAPPPGERSVVSELDKAFSMAIRRKKDSLAKEVESLLPAEEITRKRRVRMPEGEVATPSLPLAPDGEEGRTSLRKRLAKMEDVLSRLEEGESEAMKRVLEREERIETPEITIRGVDVEIESSAPGKGGIDADLIAIIRNRIESNWELDEFLTVRRDYKDLKAVVTIKISKYGSILDIIPLKRSSNPVFQESVIRAIKASDPLPLMGRLYEDVEVTLSFYPGG